MANKNHKIEVQGTEIAISRHEQADYISLTDIARHKDQGTTDDLIRNWLRNRNTIEFLGIWEQLYNPDFKPVEFDGFRIQAGLNRFTLTPKQWIESTGAIGLVSKPGRYGGTYAHKDIAFEFAAWISVEFKLYPGQEGSIRDCANVSQLVCLANLENLNAVWIEEGLPQADRLQRLNQVAIHQMRLLTQDPQARRLQGGEAGSNAEQADL